MKKNWEFSLVFGRKRLSRQLSPKIIEMFQLHDVSEKLKDTGYRRYLEAHRSKVEELRRN